MVCPEDKSADALVELFLDRSWRSRLEAVVDEEDVRILDALDEQDEVMRLQTDLLRGMEQNVENQIDQMRSILDQEDQRLEDDRIALDKLRKSVADKSALVLEQESERNRLDRAIQDLSGRALSTAELEQNFPQQLYRQKLLYKMTRMMFGKVKPGRPHALRGYVSNVSVTDITPFEIDTLSMSSHRVRDTLWDYVADGISDEFKTELKKIK